MKVPDQCPNGRSYLNHLTRIHDPRPLLADYPEWVEPISETDRFEAPILVDDDGAHLFVRAWRYSYHARGIVEMPNRLRAGETAVIMVHPWGVDDGQGWRTPVPAGVVDFCTLEKNQIAARHTREVVNPFLKSLRGKVAFIMYSLHTAPNQPVDSIHRRLYRSITYTPGSAERDAARNELSAVLHGFNYEGEPVPCRLTLSTDLPVIDYFKQFPGCDSGPKYNNEGFWELPIPVCSEVEMGYDDIVIYDAEGYDLLKEFLKANGVRHILLTGYATDKCFKGTCAGYLNLSRHFNVFLVGDATLADFPAHSTPRIATSAHIAEASLDNLITQVSWIQYRPGGQQRHCAHC